MDVFLLVLVTDTLFCYLHIVVIRYHQGQDFQHVLYHRDLYIRELEKKAGARKLEAAILFLANDECKRVELSCSSV